MTTFEGPPPWLLEELQRAGDQELPFEERLQAADRAAKLTARYLEDIIAAGMAFGGKSWTDVGKALGVTRQAAFQRFRGRVNSTEREQE